MSLNTVTFSPSRKPTRFADEVDLKTVESVEYILDLASKKVEGKGKIFLTDVRTILVPDEPSEAFQSLSIPHTFLLSCRFEPPRLFNSSRMHLEVKPSPGGGLGDAPTRIEVRSSKKDPLQSFFGALDKTRERAVNKSRTNPEEEFDLPAYGGPGPSGSSSNTTYIVADVPSDAPPGYDD